MYPQHKENVPQPQGATAPQAAAHEFYLPSGGADPDFYFPADRGHGPGRFSRWVHGLPVVGWLRG